MASQVLSSMLRINRQRRLALRRALAPYGYVGCMHLIVLYVSRSPGASQEEIACHYALDKGSVARDARRLEDKGHIRRETDPGNRRQYQLFLTEEGQKMLPVLDGTFEAFQARLSASLSPEDWQLLTDLLERLEEARSRGEAGEAVILFLFGKRKRIKKKNFLLVPPGILALQCSWKCAILKKTEGGDTMLNRVKGFLQSERAMPVVNGVFLLAMLFRSSGIILPAYGLWIAYLMDCVKRSESKVQRGVYTAVMVFAGVMLAVNFYLAFRAYLSSYRMTIYH